MPLAFLIQVWESVYDLQCVPSGLQGSIRTQNVLRDPSVVQLIRYSEVSPGESAKWR